MPDDSDNWNESLVRRPRGLYAGQFKVPSDFDDSLPDDILNLFYGDEDVKSGSLNSDLTKEDGNAPV